MAASLPEQKSADHNGELLRFVHSTSQGRSPADAPVSRESAGLQAVAQERSEPGVGVP